MNVPYFAQMILCKGILVVERMTTTCNHRARRRYIMTDERSLTWSLEILMHGARCPLDASVQSTKSATVPSNHFRGQHVCSSEMRAKCTMWRHERRLCSLSLIEGAPSGSGTNKDSAGQAHLRRRSEWSIVGLVLEITWYSGGWWLDSCGRNQLLDIS